MIGKVVSIVVAPPQQIGANGENHLTIIGANKRVVSSRIMLEISEIVPSIAPLL